MCTNPEAFLGSDISVTFSPFLVPGGGEPEHDQDCGAQCHTSPNYKDVGAFLGVNVDTGLFYFDASYRPMCRWRCSLWG